MKLFVWERVSDVSDRYHSSGGCTILAETLEDARALFKAENPDLDCGLLHEEPDLTCDVSASEPRLFVFPNAGCC